MLNWVEHEKSFITSGQSLVRSDQSKRFNFLIYKVQ